MPGMVNGTAVHILMMAHHWVQQKMKNVKLIPFRKAGRYYPGRDQKRIQMAMNRHINISCEKNNAIIQLFDPPFDQSLLNPGYIKGYVPGVRENGGQYTHAAIWLIMAFAAIE